MRSNKLKPLVIGDITIEHPLALAPMAGVTDLPYRLLCKEQGAGMMCTEMVSAKGLYYGNRKSEPLMATDPKEIPVAIQIFGSDPEIMGQMAAKVNDGRFQMIDINMGCPVPKVTKTDAGSRWLLDPDKVYEMVDAVTHSIDKPVTVKMRTGWDEDHIYAVENALAAQEGGAKALAMHGRTRKQLYSGHADWNILHEVAGKLTIPFMGNGDVRTPQDAKKMLDEVGCDAVMIGRAALGNPWILKQTVHYLETGELLEEPTPDQKIIVAKEHLHRLVLAKGEKMGPKEFRSQAAYYLKGIPRSARAKAALNSADTEEEMHEIFDGFLADYQARNSK